LIIVLLLVIRIGAFNLHLCMFVCSFLDSFQNCDDYDDVFGYYYVLVDFDTVNDAYYWML